MSEATRECFRPDCTREFYTQIALDIHIVNDHGLNVDLDQSR